MISYEEAKAFVLDSVTELEPEILALDDALGCVAGERLVATEAVPGFRNSSMDGFALRSVDSATEGTRLKVVGSTLAGEVAARSLGAGESMRIMTGAPLPDGADSVCMIEEAPVEPGGHVVTIPRLIAPGENVRHPGEDVHVGQLLMEPGDELDALRAAVLASQGVSSVRAVRRLRVGVLSTGNELVRSPRPLANGEIRDTNGPLLRGMLQESGFVAVDLGDVVDDYEQITRRLVSGLRDCDAVVSTGGVSMGDVDHVKAVIGELGGARARSMKVAIRPAKPFAFGVVGARSTPVFGLPGNPVSTRVSFELFVRPALRKMAGHRQFERLHLDAVLDVPLGRSIDGKLHLVHVVARLHVDGRVHVERAMRHGSHVLSALTGANAIAFLPDGDSLAEGDSVRVMVLIADQLGGVRS